MNEGGGNAFNTSTYEVPVSTLSALTRRTTEHQQYYEQMGAATATYEYATSGPNEQMVIIQRVCLQHSKVQYCTYVHIIMQNSHKVLNSSECDN